MCKKTIILLAALFWGVTKLMAYTEAYTAVTNSEFDSNVDGWTKSFTNEIKRSTSAKGDGTVIKAGEGHMQVWQSTTGTISQSLTGLSNGIYRFRAGLVSSGTVKLYAKSGETTNYTDAVSGNGAYFYVDCVVTDGDLEIGLELTNGKIEFDHVLLTRYDVTVEEMKTLAANYTQKLYPLASVEAYNEMQNAIAADESAENGLKALMAIRRFVESHNKAEKYSGNEIAIASPCGESNTGWTTVTEFNSNTAGSGSAYYCSDGNAVTTRFHKAWTSSATQGILEQTITELSSGKYIISFGARNVNNTLLLNGNSVTVDTNNLFGSNAGWKNAYALVEVPEDGDFTLKVEITGQWYTLTNFKMYRYGDAAKKLVQSATVPLATAENVDVRLTRTISNQYWNTFSVPFDIIEEQIKEVFGENTVMAMEKVEDNVMSFVPSTTIVAGKPYLVKPVTDVVNPLFCNVNITATVGSTVGDGDFTFTAQLYATAVATDGTKGILTQTGEIKKLTSGTIQGMRAYFNLPSNGANAKISIFGQGVTSIDHISGNDKTEFTIYNVNGVRQQSLGKGLNIINGKKIYNAK